MSVKEFLGFGKRNFGKRNFGKKVFEPKYLLQYTPRGYIIANKDTRRGYISRKGKEKYIRFILHCARLVSSDMGYTRRKGNLLHCARLVGES